MSGAKEKILCIFVCQCPALTHKYTKMLNRMLLKSDDLEKTNEGERPYKLSS